MTYRLIKIFAIIIPLITLTFLLDGCPVRVARKVVQHVKEDSSSKESTQQQDDAISSETAPE